MSVRFNAMETRYERINVLFNIAIVATSVNCQTRPACRNAFRAALLKVRLPEIDKLTDIVATSETELIFLRAHVLIFRLRNFTTRPHVSSLVEFHTWHLAFSRFQLNGDALCNAFCNRIVGPPHRVQCAASHGCSGPYVSDLHGLVG